MRNKRGMDRADRDELAGDLRELSRVIRTLTEQQSAPSPSSITVQAGGAAIWSVAWIAGLSCAFMLGMGVVGSLWISAEFGRNGQERAELRSSINANKAYLSAIYQVAPQLKPEPEKESEHADRNSRSDAD